MKQYQLLTAFLFLFVLTNAQNKIDELINAEKSFAAFSKEHSTKAAFVAFLDSNSIVFRNGVSMNGLETWNNRKEDSSLLLWGPEFAVISSSSDFGITSGPSIFRPSRAENARSFYGHFASLWHKNNEGKWKVLGDIGINHDSTYQANENVKAVVLAPHKNLSEEPGSDPTEIEQRFLNILKQSGAKLPQQMVAADARILLQGKHPIYGKELENYNFASVFTGIAFTNIGKAVSPASDMFVTYGKTKAKDKEANYLCAWIKEGKAWKLILFLMN